MITSAVLLSGGRGIRMGSSLPKQYHLLCGKPVCLYSYEVLSSHSEIDEIIVVCEERYAHFFRRAKTALPGNNRQDSLFNGLQKIAPNTTHVIIHDAARPNIHHQDIKAVLDTGKKTGAATLAIPVKETIKQAGDDKVVHRTLERSSLYTIQTPQVLRRDLVERGLAAAKEQNTQVTDDVSLAELIDHPVHLVLGREDNIKITTPIDLLLAETLRKVPSHHG